MSECVLCEQQITNPLSPERLVEQMKAWLIDESPELIDEMEERAEELLNSPTSNDFCIITKNPMGVCAYCFTEHMFRWLLMKRPTQRIVEEYLTYFSFDVSRKGYIHEAEKRGYSY